MEASERDEFILEKIIKYCDEIMMAHDEYHRSFDAFQSNPIYRNAVALCLMQIGELSIKLSDNFKETHRQIPWRAIKGMRNVVAHEYGNIDVETVWETADNDIEELRRFCVCCLEASENKTE